MSNAFEFVPTRTTKNPISRAFPELMCSESDEDLVFADQLDCLNTFDLYTDGRSQAHLFDH